MHFEELIASIDEKIRSQGFICTVRSPVRTMFTSFMLCIELDEEAERMRRGVGAV